MILGQSFRTQEQILAWQEIAAAVAVFPGGIDLHPASHTL
jgi:hypothetical protein